MFGWLKKRFGRIQVAGDRYGYRDLMSLELGPLAGIGVRGAGDGNDTACSWVLEAMVERGAPCTEPALRVIRAGRPTLAAAVLTDLHTTLATQFTLGSTDRERVAVLTEQLELTRSLITDRALVPASALLERAMPAVANMETAPNAVALLLLEGARLARMQGWDRAILALLDRRLAFDDPADYKHACLLVGIALGPADRALTHLQEAERAHPDDVECQFLLGQAHATRAKRARSQKDFEAERKQSLGYLDRARQLAAAVDTHGGRFSGVALQAASGVALLALMAPVYDEIMYLEAPLKQAAASGEIGAE